MERKKEGENEIMKKKREEMQAKSTIRPLSTKLYSILDCYLVGSKCNLDGNHKKSKTELNI